MDKTWKRILLISIIAVCAVLFWCAGAGAEPITGECGDNLTWSFENGALTISGTGAMTDFYGNNTNRAPWYNYRLSLTSVEIGNGVTCLGNYAFYSCSSLTSITIPDSVTSIGQYAFSECRGLTSITIPDSVTSIGQYAFNFCSNLTSITIPDSMTSIGDYTFQYCSNLASITIPDSVTSIGQYAFASCRGLMSIMIPDSVTSIGDYTFQFCSSLANITIPDSVTSIGDYTFQFCSSLANITIPDSVTSIGDYAFYNCDSLLDITIPDSVTSIGQYAFGSCGGLTSITIPDSLTSIGQHAFASCSGLTSITIPNSMTSIGQYAFASCSGLTSITIPDSVTSLGDYAFQFCSNLMSITIPDSVTSIGSYAFQSCSSLASITIPNSVTSIGQYAFSGCSGLTNITIPDCERESYVFNNCSSLSDITVHIVFGAGIGNDSSFNASSVKCVVFVNDVTSIGDYAFYNCDSLTDITIPDSVTSIGQYAFSGCSGLTSITIPDSVTNIGQYAFFECSGLTSITIPDCRCESYAFKNCYNLSYSTIHIVSGAGIGNYNTFNASSVKCVVFVNDVTSFGRHAFYECSSLTSITIPDSVTSIGDHAFYRCSGLTDITIPDSITNVDNYAFADCPAIRYANLNSNGAIALSKAGYSFRVPGTNCNFKYAFSSGTISELEVVSSDDAVNISIPDFATSVGVRAFQDHNNLARVLLPESIRSIKNYAFKGCVSLKSVTIPNSVTSIGTGAFNNCDSLEAVIIPSSVKSFGSKIFSNQPTIYCYEFSAAEEWARNLGLPVVLLDIVDLSSIRAVYMQEDFRMLKGSTKTIAANVFPDSAQTVISWRSSDPEIVSVEDGQLTANAVGTAVITATVGDVSGSVNVEVYTLAESFDLSDSEIWVVAKTPVELTIKNIEPENAEVSFTWSSSDTNLATVDENGQVTTLKPGDVTIHAESNNGICEECLIHLCYRVASIAFEGENLTISDGGTLQLKANVTTYTDNQLYINKLVTFTSSDESILTVDANGLVTGVGLGTATVTAASTASSNAAPATIQISVFCEGHTIVVDEAKEPTCTEPGLTEGSHCSICGAVLVEQQVVAAKGHDWSEPLYVWAEDGSSVTASRVCANDLNNDHKEIETVSTSAEVTLQPTCEAKGETTYTAVFANESFKKQQKTIDNIDALGHDWSEPVYSWAADNSQVTATRSCAHDESHIETETVDTIPEITKAATCTEKGKTRYTCKVFENKAFSVQTKTVANINALGHAWQYDYEWADDYCSVTATRVCGNDSNHCDTETAQTKETVVIAPTCEETGLSTYIAKFENRVFTEQKEEGVVTDPIGHDWGEVSYEWAEGFGTVTATRVCAHDTSHVEMEEAATASEVTKEATCEEKGETTYTSAEFANKAFAIQTKTVDDIPATGHEWGAVEYSLSADYSEMTATRVCEHDESHVETETVPTEIIYTTEPTCTESGNGTVKATFTNAAFGEKTIENQDVPASGHNWEIEYFWAEDGSSVTGKAQCHCGEGIEANGEITPGARQEPTCTAKGSQVYAATFGGFEPFTEQTKTVEIPALGHDLEHHAAKAATCTAEGWKAYDTCKRDGCTYTTYTKIAALGHSWGSPAYTWAKDYSAVTAKRVCANDSTHVESEKVATVYKVTKKATYTATGIGTYTTKAFKNTAFKVQTKKVAIDMLPRTAITKAKVTAIDDQVYTGSAIKPALTIKYNKKKLVKGTDYTVSFKNNVKPGQATVTITGKNAFKGKTTVTFTILPKKVKLVSVKPGKAMMTVTWKKGAAITGYEIEYSLKKDFSKAKTVKVTTATTVKTKIQKLKAGKTYYVRIRAYRKVGSKMYYSDWSDSMKATVPEK